MIERNALLFKAQQARQLFEEAEILKDLLASLYIAYNPEVDIDAYIPMATELFPHGNCGLATVYLRHRLRVGEIKRGSYANEGHTFLAIGSLIVDITADQFDGPPMYVGPLQAPWSLNLKDGQ
jgi:hypothetical protein